MIEREEGGVSPPGNGSGGPGLPSETATNTTALHLPDDQIERADRTAHGHGAVVIGTRLLASGRARTDRVLVPTCCWCRRPHLHYALGDGALVERVPSCSTSRTYWIEITAELPSSVARLEHERC